MRLRIYRHCFFAFALACLLAPSAGMAQGTAPAMSNVQEFVIVGVRHGSISSTNNCDIDPDGINAFLLKTLKNYGLPVFSLLEAKPSQMGIARIELLPEVITANTQDVDCTSWVSLTAQTQNSLRVPPVETPRSVVVTYWRGGVLVSSPVVTHAKTVADTFDKLSRQLSIQYNRDQPPPLPDFSEEKQKPSFVIPDK